MPKKLPTEKSFDDTQTNSKQTLNHELIGGMPSDLLSRHRLYRVLSASAVLEIVPFGRTQLHKLSANGEFPAPIRLSQGRVAWVEIEVLEWLALRIAQRDEMLAERERVIREVAQQ